MPVRPRRGYVRRGARAAPVSVTPATVAPSSSSLRRPADTPVSEDKPKRQRPETTSPKRSPRRSSRYNLRNRVFGRGRHRRSYGDFWWSPKEYPAIRTEEDEKVDTSAASVVGIDLNKNENRSKHHGSALYDVTNLVLRRGQSFMVDITLNRDYNPDNDVINLQVTSGSRPVQSKNSLIRIHQVDMLTPASWGAVMTSSSGPTLKFSVMSAADAIVGKYTLYVETSCKNECDPEKLQVKRSKHKEDFFILFNPWCEDDDVYLASELERVEYVLNDYGRIWVGSSRHNRGRPWYFGQFESDSLEAAVYLLDASYLSKQAHGNPVQIARALSAMANSNDENGVLTGNWSGEYDDGVAPSCWNGSYAILKQYMETKKPVEYGQCWVFSGLMTTLCRSLGIPARSVTNFESAHDTDFSMTIDSHWDTDGKPLSHLDDSIWNFHVWNEMWTRRHDIPDGNDGWQAVDATPQECSEGMMRCGPAPVSAIKRGDVYLGYDSKFIFAEVNGDKVSWLVDKKGEMKPVDLSTNCVGKNISTKQVGSDKRLDVTGAYKYKEGSKEEREAMRKASLYSSRKENLVSVYEQPTKDVDFHFKSFMASNGDIEYTISTKNNSKQQRTMAVRMHTVAKYYTGATGDELGQFQATAILQPKDEKKETWTVTAAEWMNNISEDATIGVYLLAEVKETGQIFTKTETTWLDKPDLELSVPTSKMKKSRVQEVTIKFKNPLSVTLTRINISVEGAGIAGVERRNIRKAVRTGEQIKEIIKIFPTVTGKREVVASLTSRQLTGIHGSVSFTVNE